MEGFCRGCLIKYEPIELLQYTERNRRLFVYSTGLQVKRNDSFTFQLCKDCFASMKLACKFKKQCRNTDKKYKNFVALKDADENVDFSTFLKTNDDSMTFRFPTAYGFSTPIRNKQKDDDNESTCTSIQNFMTDILKVDEIPDTEARIIREVIEEEADVLEDSLDSHWLQDDASVDSDFRMDFTFSPFSTPRSIQNDHCYTPRRQTEPIIPDLEMNSNKTENQEFEFKSTENQNNETVTEKIDINVETNKGNTTYCSIDKNLENALKYAAKQMFSLDDLLASPSALPNISAASTPTIRDIIFGEKTAEENQPPPEAGLYIEKYEDVNGDMDILEEFLNEDNKCYEPEHDKKEVNPGKEKSSENKDSVENDNSRPTSPKYCISNFYCKMCRKQFKNLTALKIHFRKYHKKKLVCDEKKKPPVFVTAVCDYCGIQLSSRRRLIIHISSHLLQPSDLRCPECNVAFNSKVNLKMHMLAHSQKVPPTVIRKKYVCSTCGVVCTTNSNYHTHIRRHSKTYTVSCEICGKGFYRKCDLEIHLRIHTGEKPYPCLLCERTFARCDTRTKHMKYHTDEKPYQCQFCEQKFVKAYTLKLHQKKSKQCLKLQNEITASPDLFQLLQEEY